MWYMRYLGRQLEIKNDPESLRQVLSLVYFCLESKTAYNCPASALMVFDKAANPMVLEVVSAQGWPIMTSAFIGDMRGLTPEALLNYTKAVSARLSDVTRMCLHFQVYFFF
ncbi:unnamed protein product [Gongylonema pulchrum]|uniref:Mediator complex subunit 20 n=1 Tax=Gongylonema pulchrum TaxID=637853 RepID=A0A183DBZ7_9BILA|nr:unnamed protein product [Gongylonema pulchrum]